MISVQVFNMENRCCGGRTSSPPHAARQTAPPSPVPVNSKRKSNLAPCLASNLNHSPTSLLLQYLIFSLTHYVLLFLYTIKLSYLIRKTENPHFMFEYRWLWAFPWQRWRPEIAYSFKLNDFFFHLNVTSTIKYRWPLRILVSNENHN